MHVFYIPAAGKCIQILFCVSVWALTHNIIRFYLELGRRGVPHYGTSWLSPSVRPFVRPSIASQGQQHEHSLSNVPLVFPEVSSLLLPWEPVLQGRVLFKKMASFTPLSGGERSKGRKGSREPSIVKWGGDLRAQLFSSYNCNIYRNIFMLMVEDVMKLSGHSSYVI